MMSSRALAQGNVYLNGGIEFVGMTYNYRFQQQKSFLKRGFLFDDGPSTSGVGLTFNVALHKTISPYIGIEFGSQFTEMDLVVRDADFQNRNHVSTSNSWAGNVDGVKADNGNFDFANWYYSNYAAAYFFMPGRNIISPYAGVGLAFNYFTSRARTMPATFHFVETGEDLMLTPDFSQQYWSGFLEAGLYFGSRKTSPGEGGNHAFLGLKYYVAGDIISGDYQNAQHGVVQYSDHVVTSGNYIALSLRFGTTIIKANRKRTEHNFIEKSHHRYHRPEFKRSHKQHTFRKSKKAKQIVPQEKKAPPTTKGW